MLDLDEADAVAEQFGVAHAQVQRDHLISHMLAALSAQVREQVVFFGGTALSRTYVPDGRLSEDIDLLAVGSRAVVAARMEADLIRALRREFPGLYWDPRLSEVRDTEPAVLRSPDGLGVRVQLLSPIGYAAWPVEQRDLMQRYSDAPPARLAVPTAAAFAAWKAAAWFDRKAARDLYDLWTLAEAGLITAEAGALFARFGPTNRPPSADMYLEPLDEGRWRRDLSGQVHLRVTATEALAVVRASWRAATGQDDSAAEDGA